MSSLDLPNKMSSVCVVFAIGDQAYPTFLRLTDSSSRVFVGSDAYEPEPGVGFNLEDQTGSMDEKPFRITLPTTRPESPAFPLAESLSRAEPYPPVSCSILQVFRALDGSQEEVVYLAEGSLASSVSNPDGKEGLVELEFVPAKAQLKNIKLGIPANPTCGWTYGRSGCYKDIYQPLTPADYFPSHYLPGGFPKIRVMSVELTFQEARRSQAVSLALSRTQHVGADLRTLTDMPRGWWIGAYLSRGGLSIPIRDWWWSPATAGTSLFVLGKVAPSSWEYVGASDNFLTLVPGCSKTKQACNLRQNTLRWSAFGYAIPAYNPLLDDKST